jgi:citrate lyase beta subunit
MTIRTRRALLFMPGDDRHKIEKGAALDVDTIIMDLEDGVALNNKQPARLTVNAALRELPFGRTERLVRINPVVDDPPLWQDDIAQTIEGHPDGYVLPKVEHGDQVRHVAEKLTQAEHTYGWLYGSTQILAIIETALGVVNIKEIAASDSRLSALIFGAEDLAGSLGALRTQDGWEVFYGRSAVVVHARAYGLQAIDTVFVDLTAEDSNLIADAEQALYMGYTGKLAVHPRQVEPIQRVFTPTAEQIRKARRLVELHAEHQAAGRGVFELDGHMVDRPMVRAAEAVLARARAAGIDVSQV